MTEDISVMDVMEARGKRRQQRRDMFMTMGAAAAFTGAIALTVKGGPANAQTAPTDADILNFALNTEYLEAQFYAFAATGQGLPANLLTGTGTPGQVAATGARQVAFADPAVRLYAREIYADEFEHVRFLRAALGSAAVSQPAIDIGTAPTGAFSSAARAAGLVGANESFDPYLNDDNFLLGAFIFEDVGVTAYKGASPLITNRTFLEAAAGILAVEAYHAAIIRTTLARRGMMTPALIDATEAISNARDSLDGGSDLDQGIRPIGTGATAQSNIFPSDADALAFSRSTGQVLNILYLNRMAVTAGGFFPAGVNGNLRMSAAN